MTCDEERRPVTEFMHYVYACLREESSRSLSHLLMSFLLSAVVLHTSTARHTHVGAYLHRGAILLDH